MSTIIAPQHFGIVLASVRKLTGYNESECRYEKPSLTMKLGNSLKQCAIILRSTAMQSVDYSLEKHSFWTLCDSEWSEEKTEPAKELLK